MKAEIIKESKPRFKEASVAKLLSEFERVISPGFGKVYRQKLPQLPSFLSHLGLTFEIINLSIYYQERTGQLSPADIRGLALVLTRSLEYRGYLSKIVRFNLAADTAPEVIQDLASEIKVKIFKECLRMIVEGKYLYHKLSSEELPAGLDPQTVSLNAFIFRIAKNSCIDYLRRQKLERDFLSRLPEHPGSQDDSQQKTLAIEDLGNTVDYEERYANRLTLDEAEELLPAEHREFFQLLRTGYQPGEIQKLLNLSDIHFKIIRRKILRIIRHHFLRKRHRHDHPATLASLPPSSSL